MKEFLLRRISRLTSPTRRRGVRVLLYHAIGEPDPADRMALRVSRAQFIEQMRLLRDEGYRVVPLRSLREAAVAQRDAVAVTFDDGYESQLWAAETLRSFGFTATFFVAPRFLDGGRVESRYWERWGHMNWQQAATLAAEGFDVGAHSATHPDLTTCTDGELRAEVSDVRTELQVRLGRPVTSFSYPFGRHDRRVRRAVEEAGYDLACASRYGVNVSGHPRYAVCRTEVGGSDDVQVFRLKLRGHYDWLAHWQALQGLRARPAPTS